MFRGKKYKDSSKLYDRSAQYDVNEAMDLVVKTATAKFDETIEAHIKLGVDSRHADQQVRGAIVLPNGTGKTRKVLVFAKDAKLQEALDAGADFAGGLDMVENISTQQAAPAQAPVQQAQPVQQQAPQYDQQYAQPANNYAQAAAPAAAKPNPFAKLGEWVKGHKKITLIAAAALIVVIVAIIILCNILKYQVIDAKDLFKFEFKGIDGCGYVEAELNCYDKSYYSMADATSALGDLADEADLDLGDLDDLSDYASSSDKSSKVSKYFALDKKTLTKAFNKADDFTEAKKMRNALLKTNSDGEYKLKITFDKKANKNLKNGDKVKCTVKYNEDSLKDKNIKLKNTEFEVTVKDLKNGEEIDFFKGVEVKFSGFDGNGSADVSYDSAYPFIYYDYDYKSDLKNGDKYTVTANIDVYGAEESGDMTWFEYDDKYYTYKTADVKDGKVTKDFTVEGLEKTQEVDPF